MNASNERILVAPHTPKPLPNHLRYELTAALLSTAAIPKIQSALYDTAQSAGWQDAVRERAKQIISSGQAVSSYEVVKLLAKESRDGTNSRPNIQGGLARRQQSPLSGDRSSESADKALRIKFPEQAIKEGKQFVRHALEDLVDVEGG
ncbi:MAG: hypothetical protein Q9166_006344 [cf. Caloplaca sp. 2 TL-2023]